MSEEKRHEDIEPTAEETEEIIAAAPETPGAAREAAPPGEIEDTPVRSDTVAPAAEIENEQEFVLQSDDEVERAMARMSRRSFLLGAVAIGAGFGGWKWFVSQPKETGVLRPLRRGLEFNEKVAQVHYRPARLAPTFPRSRAEMPRKNDIGLAPDFQPDQWTLQVRVGESAPAVSVTLQQIRQLPRVEMVTEFKCIEGWSNIVYWAGTRLSDFIAAFPPATKNGQPVDIVSRAHDLPAYLGLATPDGGYYIGLDMPAALHPQTLLCYEMNGAPLTLDHGAPLRLAIPVKYGIKNIKRIGSLWFSDTRPADYWAERGYDWYAGH